ncbi:MAG: hypothetical protein ACFE0Q_00595 [Anaerolineae bacterium]
MSEKQNPYNLRDESNKIQPRASRSSTLYIPNDTIAPLAKRNTSLPLRYLRTWIFSVLALIALPIGLGLVLVGNDLQTNLDTNWRETTATVTSQNSERIRYNYEDFRGEQHFGVTDWVSMPVAGEVLLAISVCDLAAPLLFAGDDRSTFTLWFDPNKPSQHSCIPITRNAGAAYALGGGILAVLSALRLLRTFNAAARR